MPLHVQILTNGRPREIRWGGFHLNALSQALEDEGQDYGWPDSYTFKEQHLFIDHEDDEHFFIFPGDKVTFDR